MLPFWQDIDDRETGKFDILLNGQLVHSKLCGGDGFLDDAHKVNLRLWFSCRH